MGPAARTGLRALAGPDAGQLEQRLAQHARAASPASASPKGTGKFGQTYSQPAEPAKGAGKPAGKPRGSQWLLDLSVPATEFGEVRPQYATLAASDCLHTQVFWSSSARPFYIDEHRVVKCAVQCQKPACPLGGMPCDKPFWAGTRLSEDCHSTHLCSHCKAGRD